MRSTVVERLFHHAETDRRIHLLTADVGRGVLCPYQPRFGDRITNVGVAEPNMIGAAAGMAMAGLRVYCYTMACFAVFRALEQIRCDLCAMRLPVTILGVGAGLYYGREGMTHHAIEDLAMMRALPGMTVFSPGDADECRAAVDASLAADGPCYVRLTGRLRSAREREPRQVTPHRIRRLAGSGRIAVFATGSVLSEAHAALPLLAAKGVHCRLYSVHTIKPMDERGIRAAVADCELVVSIEEHSLVNGLGTAVAEVLLDMGFGGQFLKLGIPDRYERELGSQAWLRKRHGLDAAGIARSVAACARRPPAQHVGHPMPTSPMVSPSSS